METMRQMKRTMMLQRIQALLTINNHMMGRITLIVWILESISMQIMLILTLSLMMMIMTMRSEK